MGARPDQLYDLVAPRGAVPFQVMQGFMTAWNSTTFDNTVVVNGATLTNLPLITTTAPNMFEADIVVYLLKVQQSYYILGKVNPAGGSYPGTYTKAEVDTLLAAKLNTTDAPELIRDTIAAALVAGNHITITVNDGANTITIASTV